VTTANTFVESMTIQQAFAGGGRTRRMRLLVLGLVLAVLPVGCSERPSSAPTPATSAKPVRVASFDFSENLILAEIYAQALRQADIPVVMLSDFGTREVLGPALEQGQVDLVIDYLGSALEAADAGNPATHGSLEYARTELQKDLTGFGVTVMEAAAAQDQNGFVVTRNTARRLASPSISSLAPIASSLVLGAPPECADRPYCLIGLESVYGLHFARTEVIDTRAATATALESGEIDVGLLETTDARLAEGRFVLLKDDKGLQPRENIIPLLRREVIDEYGQTLTDVINEVTARLTTDVLIDLNRSVEVEGETPAEVAHEWLDD
jgi:osmoprotectant transport system substrate-binding protein